MGYTWAVTRSPVYRVRAGTRGGPGRRGGTYQAAAAVAAAGRPGHTVAASARRSAAAAGAVEPASKHTHLVQATTPIHSCSAVHSYSSLRTHDLTRSGSKRQ